MGQKYVMDTVRSKDGPAIAFDRLGEGPALVLVGGSFEHRALESETSRSWVTERELRLAGQSASCTRICLTMLVRPSSCLALLCSALCTLGCADDPEPDGPCNELVNDGPDVTPELLTAGSTPVGGTITDGQYEQTGFDYYPDLGVTIPPEPRTFSAVFEFAAGSLEAVTGATFVEEEETGRYSASYAASGTELTLTYSCPRSDFVEQPQFSATDSEVRLFYRVADDMATVEVILTKR